MNETKGCKEKTKTTVIAIEKLEVCPHNPRKRGIDLDEQAATVKNKEAIEVTHKVTKRLKKDAQEALYWRMAQEQGLLKPFEEAGEKLKPVHAVEIFKIRNRSIRRFYYFWLYCSKIVNLKKASLNELTKIAMRVLNCSQRCAYDYAQCVFSIATWLF